MNKYSFRIFGTFSAEDYAKAQLAILTAVQSLDDSKVQSVELSEREKVNEESTDQTSANGIGTSNEGGDAQWQPAFSCVMAGSHKHFYSE